MNFNEKSIIEKIKKTILSYNKILFGFSGGLDSTVLLHLLIKIKKNNEKLKIRAIHINHGISKNAKKWNNHCKEICSKWNIQFISKKIKITNTKKKGTECIAREERYKTFKKMLLPEEIITVAHNLNDQIETFLLALKRGSGSKGLSGMSTFTKFSNTIIIRPILFLEREKILYYAKKYSLSWIEDETNENIKYDRNFLRLKIIPILNKRWPFFLKSIKKSIKIFKNQENLIKELIKKKFKKLINTQGALKIKYLKKYSDIKKNIFIRNFFDFHKLPKPSYVQLKEINKKINNFKKKKEKKIILNKNIIYIFQEKLWILPKFKDITNILIKCKKLSKIKLPNNLGFLLFNSKNGVEIRKPKKNETILIKFGIQGKTKIKKNNKTESIENIWRKYKIPPLLRKRIPLIYYNKKLIYIVDIFITENGQCNKKKPNINIEWIKNKIYKNIIKN